MTEARYRRRPSLWAQPANLWQTPDLCVSDEPERQHAAGHSVRLETSLRAQNASATEADPTGRRGASAGPPRSAQPPGGIVERRPAASTPVPLTADALVGADGPCATPPADAGHLRDSRPQVAAARRPDAASRRKPSPLWLRAREHDARYAGPAPAHACAGARRPEQEGAEARSAGEGRDRVATYSSGSDKARARAHIASWCLRTGMLMKLRASSSSMRCCGVARNAFSLPMPSKK